MNSESSFKLRSMMDQLRITSAQLARALNVDPSLISRWRKAGFGLHKSAIHAQKIGEYVMKRRLSPENRSWLASQVGTPVTAAAVAQWLSPYAGSAEAGEIRAEVVESFHHALEKRSDPLLPYSAVDGIDKIAGMLHSELAQLPDGSKICIYLNSETTNAAVDPQILAELREAADHHKMTVEVLVESANNSRMISRLTSAYMPLLVQGQLVLSIIQGTPQTFMLTTNLILGEQAAIIITETAQKRATAVGTVIRDMGMIRDMLSGFDNSRPFARPMMTAYNDSFARNIVEVFFEEYGVDGNLDVIKSGLNPMYLTVEEYGRILREFEHPEDQYVWRYQEFDRLKDAMAEVLRKSRLREVLSLSKLREIAETGVCRMPSMYFFAAGICHLDAQDCVNLLNGYIRYLETEPNFQVVLLDDEKLFMPNSCWHIKINQHIMIHSWNIDEPMMVYSNQLMLIEEFQRHFDELWEKSLEGNSRNNTISILRELRDRCAEKTSAPQGSESAPVQ